MEGALRISFPERIVDIALSCRNMKEVAVNKELAKLGDALLGLLNVIGMEAGYLTNSSKVTNELLRRVSIRTGVRTLLPRRTDKRDLGNAVEAAVAYWLVIGDLSCSGIIEEFRNGRGLEDALSAEIGRIDGAISP